MHNGLQMELKPSKVNYKKGETPDFNVIITNVSNKNIIFCKYLQRHRNITTLHGGEFQIIPFIKTFEQPLSNEDFIELAPKQSITLQLNVNQETNYGFVRSGSLPPLVDKSFVIKGFPEGSISFQTHIGPYVSIYDTPDDKYNYKRQRKHILRDIPKEEVTINLSKVWEGEMIAKCMVVFS
jgi:hypothetical protein